MKIKLSFTTNSSSSSFVISKNDITAKQRDLIFDHSVIGENLGLDNSDWSWWIREDKNYIKGSTSMDNFDMYEFLDLIGIPKDKIKWGDGYEN